MAASRPVLIAQGTRNPEGPIALRSSPRTTVVIVAARPAARAGLRALLAADARIATTVLAAPDLQLPEESATLARLDTATASALFLIDQTGFTPDQLRPVVRAALGESVPLLWLGHPEGIGEIAPPNGAWGVISPDANEETLIAAVHALAAGLTVADPAYLPPPKPETPAPEPAVTLTAREREVLELVAAGLPNKAIARALGISDHTAKFHVSALLAKLNAASRTEAVTIATRTGLLSV